MVHGCLQASNVKRVPHLPPCTLPAQLLSFCDKAPIKMYMVDLLTAHVECIQEASCMNIGTEEKRDISCILL